MSETKPNLIELERQIKSLPDKERAEFLARQLSHATVNFGPEAVRNATDNLTDWVDENTRESVFSTAGDWVEGKLQAFKNSRAAHWIGKAGLIALVVIVVLFILRVFYGVWDV